MLVDPRQAGTGALLFGTRKSIAHIQGGLTLEKRLGREDTLTLIGYSGQRRINQYLAFSGNGASQAGGVVDLDRSFGGLGARWTHRALVAATPLTFTAGIDYDNQAERRRGFVNNNGVAGALKRDEDDRVYNFDQYAQLEWQPSERWTVSAGLRRNHVRFYSTDHYITGAPNPDDSGSAHFEKTNPMAGVLYHLSETTNMHLNAGQGFETPSFAELAYRPDGSSGLNFALKPSVSRSLEAGIKSFVTSATRLNAAIFRIRTANEIVTGPTPSAGRNTYMNADLTARDGLELSLDSDLGAGVKAYAAYTYINARFSDYVNFAGASLSGKLIPGVPQAALHAELRWRASRIWSQRWRPTTFLRSPSTISIPMPRPPTLWLAGASDSGRTTTTGNGGNFSASTICSTAATPDRSSSTPVAAPTSSLRSVAASWRA